MSPEKQRIAIAEACGWKGPYHPDNIAGMAGWWSRHKGVWWMNPNGNRVMISSVPNYLNDLNAMHEAEKVLSYQDVFAYTEWLHVLTGGDQRYNGTPLGSTFLAARATAAQRAEAFLRTLKNWEDA